MKRATIISLICMVSLLSSWALAHAAAPRYADRELALKLAKVLDKGVFENKLISSTFIRKIGAEKYVVKVVLDNGGEQEWDMDQLRTWTKQGSLVLHKNNALVFPGSDSNEFAVFDKNGFVQHALRSNVYAKLHWPPDILAGKVINFQIYRFNVAELLDVNPGKDEQGYPHEYILDLQNGQREYLSFREAYESINRGALTDAVGNSADVERTPYLLQALRERKLAPSANGGTGEFGVDMVFDRPVRLDRGHFPFQVYEERARARAMGYGEFDFVIEVTAPNAEITRGVKRIGTLEFLRDIHAISDPVHPKRVLMRAAFNPVVLTSPPDIQVAANTVQITFTKVVDQSVLDRKAIQDEETRRRQAKLLAETLTDEEIRRISAYRQAMQTGGDQLQTARHAPQFGAAFEEYLAALTNFTEAAANASTDRELQDAMRQRNALLVNIPLMVLEHAELAVKLKPIPDPPGLKRLLDISAEMTRDEQLLKALQKLERQVDAAAGK